MGINEHTRQICEHLVGCNSGDWCQIYPADFATDAPANMEGAVALRVPCLQAMARLWLMLPEIEADLAKLAECWSQNPDDGHFDPYAFDIVQELVAKIRGIAPTTVGAEDTQDGAT